ncbi:MAG: serine/threonine-protein phosphatase [Mycoplasmataceae bacterium]|nr:serine/threonine-protein phosphatase [Mycoplasmataceae bacterium]
MYKFDYYGKTITGRRLKNEDSFYIFKNKYEILIAIVSDGMGGHKGGATASKSVIKIIKRELNNFNFINMNEEKIKKILLTSVRILQKDLKRIGKEFPQYSDMGSTMNMNVFVNEKLFTVNVGDSRTQSFIKKELIKISEDHNLGTLAEKDERYAHYRGQSNILTSSLGPNKKTTVDLFVTELKSKNGYILMSSDGVHNFISDISWMKIIKSKSKSNEYKVSKVIKTAYENGSNDNITFILIRYER